MIKSPIKKQPDSKLLKEVFDYRTLRFLIGIIAFSLPFVVSIIANERLTSISASYYTNGRDAFVGMLFIVGAFLMAYNGKTLKQFFFSKIASIAAVGIAVFPTACETCGPSLVSRLHFISAAVLFGILAYFCLGPFRTHLHKEKGKKGRRNKVYAFCGISIIISMLMIGAGNLFLSEATLEALRWVYWWEATALIAFGAAWFVSGKTFRFYVDKDQQNKVLNFDWLK